AVAMARNHGRGQCIPTQLRFRSRGIRLAHRSRQFARVVGRNRSRDRPAREYAMIGKTRFLAAFAVALIIGALAPAPAPAQTYPPRPVRFILPFGPAAGVDITARLVGDRLATRWGKPVVVENRPGGDGLVAINAFIGAADDHTLLFAPAST